jgi:thiosulfate reductase/polysulfide reductase chain A
MRCQIDTGLSKCSISSIYSENELSKGKIKAKVTEQIRPDAIFMLHGFGHLSPDLTLAYGKRLNNGDFIKAGADPIGGTMPNG